MREYKAKRKTYEPAIYHRLLDDLTSVMEMTPHLRADRNSWDIDGDWAVTGTMHFIDMIYMDRFEPFHDFDCRSIKIINFNEPAIRMTFFKKHRYWVLKESDLTQEGKAAYIQDYINSLVVKAQQLKDKYKKNSGAALTQLMAKVAGMYDQIRIWQLILQDLEQYEIAISNYHREYYYTYINYKYRIDDLTLANKQEHLLNPQRNRDGEITQPRHNIVFVDPIEILREHPYQNKEIDKFLDRFTVRTEIARDNIYARLKPDSNALSVFEAAKPDESTQTEISAQRKEKTPRSKKDDGGLPLFPEF